MKALFTPRDVARICGLSYRQIQYWDTSGFIQPSYRKRNRYRLYTFRDLVFLMLATRLREANFSVQRMRKMIKNLDHLLDHANKPIADLTFLIEGDGIMVFDGDMILDTGQRSRSLLFRVRELRGEVDALLGDAEDDEASRTG